LPTYRFSKTVGLVRGVRAFLGIETGATRGNTPDDIRRKQAQRLEAARERTKKIRQQLKRKEQQRRKQAQMLEVTRQTLMETRQQLRQKEQQRRKQAQRFEAARERMKKTRRQLARKESYSERGALPDFLIIGAEKAGTTFLYWQLCKHPYVERAAEKELHYFDSGKWFNRDVGWYRSQFPPPAWRDGQKIISGEASPYYLIHPTSPRRASRTIPNVMLIALLRNPVDRAYSAYCHKVSSGEEPLSFEEALAEEENRTAGELEKMLSDENYYSRNLRVHAYRSRGIYVDQIRRWHKYFAADQLLVLRSEDLFADPIATLGVVHEFLELPKFDTKITSLTKKRNRRTYQPMEPATRHRLEQFFEPHNQRLYEYLGVDFDW
jgi:Sulfotransferase domain